MAYETQGFDLGTLTASANYSSASSQYTVVYQTSGAVFAKCTAKTNRAIGILQDTPSSGAAGLIRVSGVSKVRVATTSHTAIAVGNKLCPSTVAGTVIGSTAVANYVIGTALEALAVNTTGIITMLITHQGGGSTGAATAA